MFPSLKSSDVLVNSFFLKGICMLLSDQTLAACFAIPAPNLTDLQNSTRFSRQFPPELDPNQASIVLCVVQLNKKNQPMWPVSQLAPRALICDQPHRALHCLHGNTIAETIFEVNREKGDSQGEMRVNGPWRSTWMVSDWRSILTFTWKRSELNLPSMLKSSNTRLSSSLSRIA